MTAEKKFETPLGGIESLLRFYWNSSDALNRNCAAELLSQLNNGGSIEDIELYLSQAQTRNDGQPISDGLNREVAERAFACVHSSAS